MRQLYLLFLSISFVFFGFLFKNEPNDSTAVKFEKQSSEVKKPTPPKKRKSLVLINNDATAENQRVNFFAPSISISKTVTVQGGGNATVGGQLNYTISLSNSASVGGSNNATGVTVTDILSSDLTLVAGSVKATPIAGDDSYSSIGNVGITVPAINGLLANDNSPSNEIISVTAVNTAGTMGNVTFNPDGSFSFSPNAGYKGTTSFTYTITGASSSLTSTGTVTITVSNPIWFINVSAPNGGNGTLSSPFNSINSFNATSLDATDDYIFIYSGTYTVTTSTLLLGRQKIIGQGAVGTSLASVAGITVPDYSNTLPNINGTRPEWNSSANPAINLQSQNEAYGFNVTGSTGTTISASSFGSMKIRDVSLNNTNGQAINFVTGALDVIFTSVSASGGSKGISVNSCTGSFQVLGTGTTAGSGGTINNIANRGAEFISVASVTLKNMNFVNANTAAGTCANAVNDNTGCNAGIHLQSITGGVSMDNIQMNTSLGNKNEVFGINMNAVNGFSLANSTITRCGTGNQEACLLAVNTTGSCTISNSTLSKASHASRFYNTNTNMTLKVTGSSFNDTRTLHDPPTPTNINTYGNPEGSAGILFEGFGTSDMKLDVSSSCQFLRIATGGIDVVGADNARMSADIQNSVFNSTNSNLTVGEDVGRGISVVSSGSAVMKFNIKNNTITGRGGDLINIGTLPGGANSTEGTIDGNTITYNFQSTVNNNAGNGIGIVHSSSATNSKVRVNNNIISGIRSAFGIDALVTASGTCNVVYTNNTVTVSGVAYDGTGGPGSQPGSNYAMRITASTVSGATVCSRVANNTVTAGALGYAQLRASIAGTVHNFEGSPTTSNWDAVSPASHTAIWNFNSNSPTISTNSSPTFVSIGGSGTKNIVPAGTCLLPSNPMMNLRVASQDIAQNQSVEVKEPELELNEPGIKSIDELENSASLARSAQIVENVRNSVSERSVAAPQAGETITVNGAGSGFTLPAGKSTTITFSATISNSPGSCSIPNFATVSGSNITTTNSNTTTTNIVIPSPTGVTTATTICNGQSVDLSATCSSGTVQWYNSAVPGTLLGTSNSGESFNQSPSGNTTYQAACKVGGCESARTNSGLITVNQSPSITAGASPAICEGATSFTIPYTSPSNSPTTYSISGTGITTVTNGALPANTITVGLSSPASGSSYSYTLTVKNANNCVSNIITGSVTVNPVPTITTSSSPAICAGATLFAIPYTGTTGTPTTYSISGTGITTITNGAFSGSSPITVNLSSPASGSSISYTLTVRNAGGCTSSNVIGSVTVNPLPTLTTSVSPAICAGATSFNIPFTATSGSPTTYSISGVGIATVTDASLPGSSPISVSLSSGASGSSISYVLTVKNADGCTSNNINGSVIVNPLPTITTGGSPAICAGATTFTIPYTATTGTPTLYSVSGVGITTVTDVAFPASSPITVGLSSGASGSSISYILTLRNANGCLSNNVSGSVTVNSTPAPTDPIATPSNLIVSGPTTLTASGCSSPSTISWYDSSNPLVALPNNTPTISSNKTFFARCTGTNTCVSEPSTNVNVTYNPCTPLVSSPGNVNITWTGLLSTDWNTACNWNPAWVPDLTTGKAIIPNTANKPVISGAIPDIKSVEIQSSALLTINNGGTLNVRGDGGLSKGFTIAGGTVTNNGTINIESATNTAIPAYIYLQATDAVLTNNGTVKINSSDEAIGIGFASTPATITNNLNGIINIVGGIGVEIALPTDVVNFNNAGTINYDGSVLAFKFLGTTNFTNTGTVNINSGTGIENPVGNTIANNACGKILMTSGTYTNGGTTNNYGLIQMPNSFSFTNTGIFTNNGVLKANLVSGIANNKMVITNACPIFTLGGSNNFTVSGIYTSIEGSTTAGTYTAIGNKFTADNSIPSGVQTLFARISDGTCTFSVPFDFDNNKPTAVSSNKTTICQGESITLSASCTSGTVTWYSSATSTISLGTGASFSYVPSIGASQTFYAACESTNCISGRSSTSNTVTVNSKPEAPVITAPTTKIVCSPSTLTLTESGCAGGTITWSEGSATGSSLILSSVGTYSISASCTINGCTSNASAAVTGLEIIAQPTAPVISPPAILSVCFPSTLTLTASGCVGGTITWSEGASQGSSLVISNVGSYNVSATCTINGCTSDNSNLISNLEIKSKPGIPSSVSVDNAIVCLNSNIVLSANCSQVSNNIFSSLDDGTIDKSNNGNMDKSTSAIPSQIIWYNQAEGGSSVGIGTNLTLSPTSNTTYYAVCSSNGCESDRVATSEVQVVTSFANPTAVSVNKTSICNSGTVSLSATCQTGTVTWYTSANGGISVGTGSLLDQSVNENITYYASCEGGNCVSERVATMPIVVNKTTIACNLPIVTDATSNCGAVVTYSAPVVQSCNVAGLQTQTYNYTGSVVDWVVPSGVTSINIKAWGAQGGANWINNTNFGGYSEGVLSVTPGEILKIYVGEQPSTISGGWNGGGAGDGSGKGGGGASDVRQGGSSLNDRKIVAAGGGGAGYWSNLHVVGGVGGGLTGGDGYRNTTADPGGKGATQTAGGANGTCVSFNVTSLAGSLGQGGTPNGYNCGCEGYGGGGGYYGGAGSGNCRGGGGGSGYIGGVTSGNMIAGLQSGHGKIEISYMGSQAPVVTQTAGLASGAVFPAGTTTNTFQVNDNGYITTCSFNVTINNVSTSISYNGTDFCKTITPSTLPVTIIGLTGGTFSSSPAGLSINSATGGIDLVASEPGTYTVSYLISGCDIPSSTTITIKSKPAAPTITSPDSKIVCFPSTLTLNASGCTGGTITWSEGSSTGSSLVLSTVGTYSVSATCSIDGCTSVSSTLVTDLEIKAKPEKPTITSPGEITVCYPSSLTLNTSCTSGTVLWSDNSTETSLTISAVGTYNITAKCVLNGCESDASDMVSLEIKAKPEKPIITSPNQTSECFPGTLTLTTNCTSGTILWSDNSTSPSLTLSAVGKYTITAKCILNGCESDISDPVNLEIKAKPEKPIITPPSETTVCSPTNLTLTTNCTSGTILWSDNSTGTSLTLSAVGTYNISAKCILEGCESEASEVVSLEIKAKPQAPLVTPPSEKIVCSPATLNFSATNCEGTVTWSEGGSIGTTLILSAVGNYSLSATCTVKGCISESSASITNLTINEEVKVTTSPQNVGICQGNNATFSIQANLPDVSYQWEVNTGSGFVQIEASAVYSGQNTATLTLAFPPESYNGYQYRCVVSKNGCSAISSPAILSTTGSAEALNIVNVSPISGVYSQTAVAYTLALNKIEPNANVIFKSGNAIELLPGFETKAGVVFSTKIESPCGINISNSSNFNNLPKEIRK